MLKTASCRHYSEAWKLSFVMKPGNRNHLLFTSYLAAGRCECIFTCFPKNSLQTKFFGRINLWYFLKTLKYFEKKLKLFGSKPQQIGGDKL